MMNKSRILLLIGILLVVVVVIVVILQVVPLQPGQSNNLSSNSGQSDPRSIGLETTGQAVDGVLTLETLLYSSDRNEQKLTLYNTINEFTVPQLVDYLVESEAIVSTSLRRLIQQALVQRLAMSAPEQALNHVDELSYEPRTDLISWIFSEWSLTNFDKVVAAALQLSESERKFALAAILNTRRDLSLEDHLKSAKKYGYEQLVVDRILLRTIESGSTGKSPTKVWKQLVEVLPTTSIELSETQLDVIAQFVHQWIEQDGVQVLQAVAKSLDSYSNYAHAIGNILVKIGEDNPRQALQLAVEFDLYNRPLLSQIFEVAASNDPVFALNATSQIASISTRGHVQQIVISSWIESDVEAVLDNLSMIPENLRQWSEQEALLALLEDKPEFVASYISSVEDEEVKSKIVPQLVWEWGKTDPTAAFEWAREYPDIRVGPIVLHRLDEEALRSIAQEDSHLAMQIALEQPIEQGDVGLEAVVIGEMMRRSVDDAIAALHTTRNEATKRAAYSEVGRALVFKGHSETAIELVEEFPPDVQAEYFDSISFNWAWYEPSDLIDKLESLPSNEIRENLATILAGLSFSRRLYTPEQTKKIKEYLPPSLHSVLP